MDQSKIVILDFLTAEVHVYNYNEDGSDPEDKMEDLGHNSSDCNYMIVKELKLNIH